MEAHRTTGKSLLCKQPAWNAFGHRDHFTHVTSTHDSMSLVWADVENKQTAAT